MSESAAPPAGRLRRPWGGRLAAAPAARACAEHLPAALVALAVFVFALQLAVVVTSEGHDHGSQAAIEYWLVHGQQFGRDLVQNVGPLGFLAYPSIHTGFLDDVKLVLNLALTAVYGLLVALHAPQGRRGAVYACFIAATLLFAAVDATQYLLPLLAIGYLMGNARPLLKALLALLLAVLALTKVSLLFIALALVGAAVFFEARERSRAGALAIAGAFAGGLVAAWLLCGQAIANLPAFIASAATFISGYNDAMALHEDPRILAAGAATLVLMFIGIAWRATSRVGGRMRASLLAIGLIEALIVFAAWKHGFVRADRHVMLFFHFSMMASFICIWPREAATPGDAAGRARARTASASRWGLQVATLASCLAGIYVVEARPLAALLRFDIPKLAHARSMFAHLADRSGHLVELDAALRESIRGMRLERSAAIVGPAGAGYFGILPGPMLYNDFPYRTAPSTISFASWNRSIMQRDAAYYADPASAPRYLVIDLQTIDGRLVAQDSSLSQLEIYRNYRPIAAEAGKLLLERQAGAPPAREVPLGPAIEGELGDWIDVPGEPGDAVWVRISLEERPISRLIALAYKPLNTYRLSYYTAGRELRHFRYMPRMGEIGFLVNPVLDGNDALLAAWSADQLRRLRSGQPSAIKRARKISVACELAQWACPRRARVEFFRRDDLGFGSVAPALSGRLAMQMLDFDLDLSSIETGHPVHTRPDFGARLHQFHAPARLVARKPAGAATLSMHFGMFRSAYEGDGRSDGVVARVRFAPRGAATGSLLWERTLDPAADAAARGIQQLQLALPSAEGEVTIEVDPRGSPAWDHFFLSRLHLR